MEPPRNMNRLAGISYHEGNKALHIRLDRHDTIPQVVDFVNRRNISEAESLHLSLADGLFQPEHTDQTQLLQMCRDICGSSPRLKEIHIGRALSGFILTNAGAWCPVEAIQALLDTCGSLQCIMIRNLQVYSVQQSADAIPPVNILAGSLRGHQSLKRFGWQHNELIPRGRTTLDPMLESLSNIQTLNEMMIQSPPWAVFTVPTKPLVLKNLVGPNLKSLHLDGLQLQAQHISSLLGRQTKNTALQKLSLSLQLTLGNIHEIGTCLANFLEKGGSSLQHLGLRLEWLVENKGEVNDQVFGKRRLEELQYFQQSIALAIKGDNQLQRLDLIYYDCSRRWSESAPAGPSKIFRDLLQTNFTLTHLRLPFCAELDPMIGFLLKLNRTGLRQKLLEGSPTRMDCFNALVEMQQASNENNGPDAFAMTGFSMLFHLLREMPAIFL